MPLPSDDEVRTVLRARGAAKHVVCGGRAGLIRSWREFVFRVEGGYGLGLEDYRNELDIRTLIEVTGISPEVAAEDERLRHILEGTECAVWSSDVPGAFWVMGYPSNAGCQLLQDLRAASLL